MGREGRRKYGQWVDKEPVEMRKGKRECLDDDYQIVYRCINIAKSTAFSLSTKATHIFPLQTFPCRPNHFILFGKQQLLLKQTLMHERQQFYESDSEDSLLELPDHTKVHISILKHIPAARKILDGQNKAYEIFSPRCLFQEELTRTNKCIMPRADQSAKLVGNRLISIQDAMYEYGRMKDKMKEMLSKQEKDCTNTLWDVYGERQIYYSRFQPKIKKHNFANLFMNIAGVNLEAKSRLNNFPQIKSKNATQLCKNNGSLIFDSHFQSGNLMYVYKNNDEKNTIETYDLILQNDINTRGHNQWFYFKITNTRKNQKIRINIVNLVKKESLFSYGLKPLTYSEKNSKNGITWVRNGQKVSYDQGTIKRQHKPDLYQTLSFEYQFREAFDTVYFAPSYPYTYSQLIYFMDSLLAEKKYSGFISIKKLCETVGKNTINLITISTGKQAVKQSKIIWILARQHPVETTSSFMVEGIITHLLNLMIKAVQTNNSFYDNYIFKIIPMVNPDGVIHGNTRAELTGIDSNRVWKKPSKNTTPSIYHIKKKIQKTREQTCLILDLHSHSKKLGCFFYGNYSQSDVKSFRLFPSTVCQNDIRFCYKNCRFRGGNDNSARRSLFNDLGIPNIFTVQCSLLGYIKDNRINQYKITDYHEMGARIIDNFFTLEKEVYVKLVPQVKEYPHEANDCCDAQSARSDSCVSDQEYHQVYNFVKAKKKKDHSKHPKPRSNTFIHTKHQHSETLPKKMQNSTAKVIQTKPEPPSNDQDRQRYTTIHSKQSQIIKPDAKRQFSIKLRNNKLNSKNIKAFLPKKKMNSSIKEEMSIDQGEIKTYNQKSIQVEQLKLSNENIQALLKNKTEKKLMVVGNSVEEDKIYVGKNQVGIQMDNSTKENMNALQEHSLNKRTVSNKINVKLNRRITEFNENLKLDRSFKPERRGVLMFRN